MPILPFRHIATWPFLGLLMCMAPLAAQPDTYQYRLFTMADGLSQMKVTSLHADSRGYLWIGTRNGLNVFNGESFRQYGTVDGLAHQRVHDIGENSRGEIILLTYDGISFFDGAGFRNYRKPFIYVVYDFFVDSQDNCWIFEINTGKLYRFQDGIYHSVLDSLSLPENPRKMHHDETKEQIYLSYRDGPVYQLLPGGKTRKESSASFAKIHNSIIGSLPERPLFHRLSGPDSMLLYGMEDGRARLAVEMSLSGRAPKVRRLQGGDIWLNFQAWFLPPASSRPTREFVNVNDVARDGEGQLWLGTENGLVQLYGPAFEDLSPVRHPYIWSVIEGQERQVWLASYGKGLFRYTEGQWPPESVDPGQGLAPEFLAASAKDSSGCLYFGNIGGLLKYDGREFQRIYDKAIFALAYDARRQLLIAGASNALLLFGEDGNYQAVPYQEGLHESYYVQAIGVDKNFDYWLGSYTGVSHYGPDEKAFRNFTMENGRLEGRGVYCILSDSQGHLWMGGEKGLLWYDYNGGAIRQLPSVQLQTIVKSLADFDSSHLLLGAKDGLYLFDKEKYFAEGQVSLKVYNHTNGYAGIEPGFNGLYKDSGGKIWIASATELSRLDPGRLDKGAQFIKANITRFNEKALPFRHRQRRWEAAYGRAGATLEFEAIGTTRPARVKFQYRLNEEAWSDWVEKDRVAYSGLPAGRHRFQLRAGPSDADIPPAYQDELHFVIRLPFYQAAWFLPVMIGLALTGSGLGLFFFFRQRLLSRRYARQLQAVNYLRSQLLLAELNPHFIFNVLASIQSKILQGRREEASNYLVKLAQLIRNFLDASHQSNTGLAHHPENEISLAREIELIRAYVEFEQMKSNDQFDFELLLGSGVQPELLHLPPMLLQPHVENAIKHGLLPAGKRGLLSIKIDYVPNELLCVIEDDGVGLGNAPKTEFQTHKPLGSRIVRERAELLNQLGYRIDIRLEARTPHGTRVTITIKEEGL